MSGTIYLKADNWTSGSWTKKIQIADLDVPATLKLNQGRGLNFVLPASPESSSHAALAFPPDVRQGRLRGRRRRLPSGKQ